MYLAALSHVMCGLQFEVARVNIEYNEMITTWYFFIIYHHSLNCIPSSVKLLVLLCLSFPLPIEARDGATIAYIDRITGCLDCYISVKVQRLAGPSGRREALWE